MLGYTARTKRKFLNKKAKSFIGEAEHFRSILKSENRRTTYTMYFYIYLLMWVKVGFIIFAISISVFRGNFQGLQVKLPNTKYRIPSIFNKKNSIKIWIDKKGKIVFNDYNIRNKSNAIKTLDKIYKENKFNKILLYVDFDAKMGLVNDVYMVVNEFFSKKGKVNIIFMSRPITHLNMHDEVIEIPYDHSKKW